MQADNASFQQISPAGWMTMSLVCTSEGGRLKEKGEDVYGV